MFCRANEMYFVPYVFSFLFELPLEDTMLPVADQHCVFILCFFFDIQFDSIALYCSSSSIVQFPSRIETSSSARQRRTLYGALNFIRTGVQVLETQLKHLNF
jgi:hypothetical protein